MTRGTYILDGTKSGMHEERRQYPEGTTEGPSGAVSDHSTTRKRETIRHNKSESYGMKYLEAGLKGSVRNVVRRFRKCRNHRNGTERAKMCEVSGIALLRLGSNISARIMSAKME